MSSKDSESSLHSYQLDAVEKIASGIPDDDERIDVPKHLGKTGMDSIATALDPDYKFSLTATPSRVDSRQRLSREIRDDPPIQVEVIDSSEQPPHNS